MGLFLTVRGSLLCLDVIRVIRVHNIEGMSYIQAADGARIHYRVTGPVGAEPLVVSGGRGRDRSGCDLLLPSLSRFRVLRLDTRGTGRSDKPQRPYSIQQMALDVAL